MIVLQVLTCITSAYITTAAVTSPKTATMPSILPTKTKNTTPEHPRPDLILQSIEDNAPIYYFGVGSNMLRSKIENRGLNGTKIDILTMEPARVPQYRLAFSMRGFPPLEPGMGSLEPIITEDEDSNHKCSFTGHDHSEMGCHGALVQLTPENYDKLWKSEGGGSSSVYEEIIVKAFPYDGRPPVNAVALRTREPFRLKRDLCPSPRYMAILCDGAKELGLEPQYQTWLADHPVQTVSPLLRQIAVHNIFFTFTLFRVFKTRIVSKIQSWFVWKVFVSSTDADCWKRSLGDLAVGAILLPGSIVGCVIRLYMHVAGKSIPPMLKSIAGIKT